MDELLSTTEAAERLGVTVHAVQKMIEAGTLMAAKIGRDYIVQAAEVKNLERRPAGKPPKPKADPSPSRRKVERCGKEKCGE